MPAHSALRINWRYPLSGALGALIVFLSLLVFRDIQVAVLAAFLLAVIISLVLFLAAILTMRRHTLSVFLMLLIFGPLFWFLLSHAGTLRTAGRWFVGSRNFKAQVLAQPAVATGELKHVEWDGWGFAGSDTTVYLVADPSDTLGAAARSGAPGKFPGLPCKVARVRRLESHWYTVKFYTETDWDHCSGS